MTDNNWRQQAACAGMDPDLFFPGRGAHSDDMEQAKKICRTCPVQIDCLEFAIQSGEHFGVWGGMSERQRRRERRRRGIVIARPPRSDYTAAQRSDIVAAARRDGVPIVCYRFDIDPSTVYRWLQNADDDREGAA